MSESLGKIRQLLQSALTELDTYEKALNATANNALKQITEKFPDTVEVSRQPGRPCLIRPKKWLGDKWNEINELVKQANGKWISAGKDSCWELP